MALGKIKISTKDFDSEYEVLEEYAIEINNRIMDGIKERIRNLKESVTTSRNDSDKE